MEAVAVFGGGRPSSTFVSSSLRSPPTPSSQRRNSCLCYAHHHLNLRTQHQHQHQPSSLNSSSLFSPFTHAKIRVKRTKPRIFLPHLVASMEERNQTYIMIKPDGVQRGLVGEIITRFEKKGFKLTGLKLFKCPQELAEEHYKELSAKPFYPKLIEYITSGPVVCMAWEGSGVVASARKLIGATNPLVAEPGTIRGDLAVQTGRNVIHGSDSIENGKREIELWFKEGEVCEWTPAQEPWVVE